MDKRFFSFFIAMTVVTMIYFQIYAVLNPPPKRPLNKDKNPAVAKDDANQGDDNKTDKHDDTPDNKSDKPDKAPDDPASIGPDGEEKPVRKAQPRRLVSLGSLTAGSPYRYLAIFDSRAGTLQSLELSERNEKGVYRYQDLEKPGGYLGRLGLTENAAEGCRVNVVGDGTPAALAQPVEGTSETGLRVDDVITTVNATKIISVKQFELVMSATRRGDEISLTVLRGSKEIKFKVQLTKWPLAIIQPETTSLAGVDPEIAKRVDPQGTGELVHRQSFLLAIGKWNIDTWDPFAKAEIPESQTENWETKLLGDNEQPTGVEFRYVIDPDLMRVDKNADQDSAAIEIVKRFTLTKTPQDKIGDRLFDSYHLTMDIEITNQGKKAQTIAYKLDGPRGLPLEGWWYQNKVGPAWGAAGARDVVWASQERGYNLWRCPSILSYKVSAAEHQNEFFQSPTKGGSELSRTLAYVGNDTQYFTVLMKPKPATADEKYVYSFGLAYPEPVPGAFSKKDLGVNAKVADTSFELISDPHELSPGTTWKQSFTVFAGPKLPDLLVKYGVDDVTYYGWFEFVSLPLVSLLHLFFQVVRNYGLAIVLLTVLVRACMVPISRKAALNAQMMQALAPEIKKIADKYKTDMEKRHKAQQELFKKYNYNPFGGCLLMFLQLPVFIGLYRGLSVDTSLRDQPLLAGMNWCSNLGAPDQLLNWSTWMPSFLASETGWLGPYLNVLPIVTIVLFIIQQKMFTPPPTDEQQVMTQKMMKYMMIFMGVMFFKVPSGLCIYFITSSIWGIAERKLLPKPQLPDHMKPPADGSAKKTAVASKPSPNGSNGGGKKSKKRNKGRR